MFRTCVICCALAGAVGLTIGCSNSPKDTKHTGGNAESLKSYATQLDAINKQVTELEAKVAKAAGEEKTRLEAKLKDATAKRDAAKKKLDELKAAAADKWDALNKETESAFEDLKKAIKE
jgi:hypothetical protein